MSVEIQIRRAAEIEIAAAQFWYETQRSGLGAEFLMEVSQIFIRLVDSPLIYPAVYRDVRRAVVRRFPYLIWYQVLGDDVTALACSHCRLAPSNPTSRA